MRITTLQVAIAVAGLLGLSGVAQATTPNPTYTYEFEATGSNPTVFNNSTITIDGSEVTGFSFYDTDLSSTPYTTGIELENDVTSYDTSGWSGEFEVSTGFSLGVESALIPVGQVFTATGDSMDESSAGPDPLANGVWTYQAAGVPDGTSTFPLLLGVLAALAGIIHYSNANRPRALALVRSK
jgi:hypothetical protein